MVLGLRRLPRFMLALSLLGLLLGTLPAPAVSAATTYTVNVLTDTGAGSGTTGDLRYAITQVNAGSGGDTINITATGTITLTGGTLMLNKDVMIIGPGANLLAIDGGCTTCDPVSGTFTDGVEVFAIGETHPTVTISNVTITHGNASGGYGGAIENFGTLTLRDATIARNHAFAGGGIYQIGATLILDRTTFEGNTADQGGAIDNNSGGILTATNSTFANNRVTEVGGAILTYNQATFAATTISGNGATIAGGGILRANRTLALTGSIVAGNTASTGPDVDNYPTVTGGGYNVIGSPAGNGFVDGANHDRVGTAAPLDPGLAALGGYNGTNGTQTFALLPGSPALDTIPAGALGCGTTLAVDGRGIARPQPTGGACDSGAFEARYSLAVTGGSPQSALPGQPFGAPLAVTLGGADGVTALGGATITFAAPASGASATLGGPNPATTDAGGLASVTATANSTLGGYSVTASTPGAASATFSLTNAAPVIALAPATLPDGVKGIAYPPQTITASGGAVPYTFAVTAGALPSGLSLTSAGALSGTPTAVGTFTFTVTATDANSFTGTQAYTIGVTAAPLVSIAVAPNPATVKVGQVQQLTATGTYADSSTADLTSQVTWSGDAPNAVTVDTSGKVTGKAAGSAHITATQGTVSGQATVTVSPPVLTGVQPAPAPANRPGAASVPTGPASAPPPAPAPPSR